MKAVNLPFLFHIMPRETQALCSNSLCPTQRKSTPTSHKADQSAQSHLQERRPPPFECLHLSHFLFFSRPFRLIRATPTGLARTPDIFNQLQSQKLHSMRRQHLGSLSPLKPSDTRILMLHIKSSSSNKLAKTFIYLDISAWLFCNIWPLKNV